MVLFEIGAAQRSGHIFAAWSLHRISAALITPNKSPKGGGRGAPRSRPLSGEWGAVLVMKSRFIAFSMVLKAVNFVIEPFVWLRTSRLITTSSVLIKKQCQERPLWNTADTQPHLQKIQKSIFIVCLPNTERFNHSLWHGVAPTVRCGLD